MVAETAEVPSPSKGQPAGEEEQHWAEGSRSRRRNRGGVRRLIASIVRLADIQLQIWLTQTKITVVRIAFYMAFFGVAAIIGTLAVIFLLLGLFHILTDVFQIPLVWAYLIFGAFLLGVAATLMLIGQNILHKKAGTDGSKKE
jgi:hypothetical protein